MAEPLTHVGALPISYYFRFAKGGALDEEGLKAEGLNDAQIELLKTDFVERGLLVVEAASVDEAPKRGRRVKEEAE